MKTDIYNSLCVFTFVVHFVNAVSIRFDPKSTLLGKNILHLCKTGSRVMMVMNRVNDEMKWMNGTWCCTIITIVVVVKGAQHARHNLYMIAVIASNCNFALQVSSPHPYGVCCIYPHTGVWAARIVWGVIYYCRCFCSKLFVDVVNRRNTRSLVPTEPSLRWLTPKKNNCHFRSPIIDRPSLIKPEWTTYWICSSQTAIKRRRPPYNRYHWSRIGPIWRIMRVN